MTTDSLPSSSERDRCPACQAVTDAGKPTNCPECPERIREEQEKRRERISEACRGGVLGPVM